MAGACLLAAAIPALAASPSVNAPPTVGKPSTALSSKAPAAAALLSAAQSSGSVPVIIELNTPAVAATARSASGATEDDQRRANVKSVVDPFVAELFGSRAGAAAKSSATAASAPSATVKSMPFLPLVATTVSADDLERVAADPRVKSIVRDGINFVSLDQSVPLIGGVEAAAAGATGAGTTIGILDTGFQTGHAFFGGRVVRVSCHSHNSSGYTTLCPNGGTSQSGGDAAKNCTGNDDCAHGTHVAGIAAGYKASAGPHRGVAPSARIFAIQVFSRPTAGGHLGAFDSDIIAGLQDLYAARTSLNIVSANLSLGGGLYSSACNSNTIKATIDLLRAGGIATVVGAGNDASRTQVSAPGCVATAVTVGASNDANVISSYTNMSSLVDLMAPGDNITSSIPTSTYATYRGTSMAAPHVAGAFAALKSAVPAASIAEIETALKTTGVTIVDNRSGGTVSKPRIDINRALAKLKQQYSPPVNDKFSAAIAVSRTTTSASTVTGTNVRATLETGEPRSISGVQGTVWWRFTASRAETVKITTSGSAFDTTLGVFRGTSVSALTTVVFNDNAPGTTTSTVTFTSTVGQTYYVQVGGNGAARGSIRLTFDRVLPVNDNFSGAIALAQPTSSGIVVSSVTGSMTLQTSEPRFTDIGKTAWWKFTPTVSSNYLFDTAGSDFNTTLAIYRGTTFGSLALVASNDDNATLKTSRLTVVLYAGTQYYIQIGGYAGASGSLKLSYKTVGPANDMLSKASVLTGSPGTVTGTNGYASIQTDELRPFSSTRATVWWKFTAGSSKVIEVSTAGSSFDTTLVVMYPTSTGAWNVAASNNDDGTWQLTTSRVRFTTVAGRTYYIQVGSNTATTGTVRLSFPVGTPLTSSQAASLN